MSDENDDNPFDQNLEVIDAKGRTSSLPINPKSIIEKEKKTLINFDDISDENLNSFPYSLKANDCQAAAEKFLYDYVTEVTIKDPITKNFNKKTVSIYQNQIMYLLQSSSRIIDIDYAHFSDFAYTKTYAPVDDIIKKYGFDYPLIDVDKLTTIEKDELFTHIYAKKLLDYLEKDKVVEFQRIVKDAALKVFIEHYHPDINLDMTSTKEPETARQLNALHIGVKNFTTERNITEIRSDLLNRAVVLKGSLLVYDEKTRVEVIRSGWGCLSCHLDFIVYGSNRPKKCPGCSEHVNLVDRNRYETRDYIYIKIQQHGSMTDSSIGMTDITVKVEGLYLVDQFHRKIKQNNSLKITGIVKLSSEIINRSNLDERNLQIDAMTVEVEGENAILSYSDKMLELISRIPPEKIEHHYTKLERSIAPHLHGLEFPKAALLLQAVGAVARINRLSKYRLRGDIHMAFLGDSSLGKSELGLFLCKILPLSIRTIGGKKTTTAAALTTTYETNNNVRQVVNGVLPRCDLKGAVIIDELDKRDPEDFQVLSIPMDDNQIIPTHKGTYHVDVHARCPILAIGNSTKKHGKWDKSKTIMEQTTYASWLLSRFDIVFVMVDDGDMKRKEQMIEHMAKSRAGMISEIDYNKSTKGKALGDMNFEKMEKDITEGNYDGIYDVEWLRHEIHWLKQNFKPILVPGSTAEALLKKEYLKFSQITLINAEDIDPESGTFSQAMMDTRAYNGIERLAIAVARCRRHHKVTLQDMEKAIALMSAALVSTIPQPRTAADKMVTGDMAIYRRLANIVGNPNKMNEILDAEQMGWIQRKEKEKKIYKKQLNYFNDNLFRKAMYRCKDCHGDGFVTVETGAGMETETCDKCKGAKRFNKSFSYIDLEMDLLKNIDILPRHRIKIYFDKYKEAGVIKQTARSSFDVALHTVDPVFMADFVDSFADSMAERFIQEEKKKYVDKSYI